MVITEVEKLEPLSLRIQWMDDLAQAVAFLESLNLAHGDLRPENILPDRDRLKLADFDSTAEVGSDFETCTGGPYGRRLNGNEPDQGRHGSEGFLGPRTEQFALGSLYYLINYGFAVYGDRCLTEDPREHGRKVWKLLQNMEFPKLGCDPRIDEIIDKCWHNRYSTVAELAARTKVLLTEEASGERPHPLAPSGEESPGDSVDVDHNYTTTDSSSMGPICEDLRQRGLLDFLALNEPEQLGFSFEFYRYSMR